MKKGFVFFCVCVFVWLFFLWVLFVRERERGDVSEKLWGLCVCELFCFVLFIFPIKEHRNKSHPLFQLNQDEEGFQAPLAVSKLVC